MQSSNSRNALLLRLGAVFAALAAPLVLWDAIHRFTGFATLLADGARKVVGPKAIAKLEDAAYGIQDAYNKHRYHDAPPAAYWSAPAPDASAEPLSAPAPDAVVPTPFKPPFRNVAAAGDGAWIPIAAPWHPNQSSGLFKALVHPDPTRSYAVLAVVAIDVSRVRVHAIPGVREPKSKEVPSEQRPGRIPARDYPDLIAAFNGGFQAVHGRWGMMVDGQTLLSPRPMACTIARYRDGAMRVAAWQTLEATAADIEFFRQTPPCLVTSGAINPAATVEDNANWGATVEGDTIIRRSAFGVSADGKLAFYGMGDALSAGSLAKGMRAAGASDVAQLDVNFSYPRFFFYDGATPPHVSQPLAPMSGWKEDEYLRPAARDFFYMTRLPATSSPPPVESAAAPAAESAAPRPDTAPLPAKSTQVR